MRRRSKGSLAMLLLIASLAGGLLFLYWRATAQYKGYPDTERFVEIPSGSGAQAIAARLVQAGVVRDRMTFRLALLWSRRARALRAGEYRFDRPMSAFAVIDRLARGDVFLRTITFPEGLTVEEMANVFESEGFGSGRQFVAAARERSLIVDLDGRANDLEGYLFPDTYALPRRAAPSELIRLMVTRFRQVFDEQARGAAAARGLSVREAVTLASLVEKETSKAEELPLVAGVYLRRLALGMPLQADPTVIYAASRAGRYNGNLRRADLAADSPYNTYTRVGLPPGPIAAPGAAALGAAIHPVNTEYLYFVSRNDGSHAFARTLQEHNANVQRYQLEFFREKRASNRR